MHHSFSPGRHRLRLRRWTNERDGHLEAGFILLESIVAITLVTIVMGALTAFFISATDATGGERTRQTGFQLIDTQMDQIRGVSATNAYLGRSSAVVTAQYAAAPSTVTPYLSTMDQATDTTASTPSVPMSATTMVAGLAYTTTNYLGWCYVPNSSAVGSTCTNTAAAEAAGTRYLRAVVATTWQARGCPSNSCSVVDSTLLSAADDPKFVLGQSAPAAPIINDPGNQTSAVNDTVSLQLALQSNTGVAPVTWQTTSLPTGLSMDTNGLITGTPTTTVSSKSITVTATDAFLRKATDTFTWTVLPDLVPASPGAQVSYVNTAISALTLSASGGSGSPYTWTDPSGTLPGGLSLSSGGTISGSATTTGTYAVKLTVADSSGRTRKLTFSWTVLAKPTISGLSTPFSVAAGATISSQALTYTCPTSSCTFAVSGAPVGIGLASSSSGTPASSITVSNTSGTIYLLGTVSASTSAGSYTVKVTPTDNSTSTSFAATTAAWTILSKPTVTGLTTPFTASVGVAITTQSLSYTCPTGGSSTSCTYTLSGAPSGIVLSSSQTGGTTGASVTVTNGSGTIYLRGTVTGSAGSYTVKVTPVDNANNQTGTANTAAWTVVSKPTVTGLTTPYAITTTGTVSAQALAYTCPSSNCTYTVTGAPTGVGLDLDQTGAVTASVSVTNSSGTIYLRGAANGNAGSYTVVVTPTDNATSQTGPTATAAWTVLAKPSITGLAGIYAFRGYAINPQTLTYTCPTASCTYTLTGAPSGIGLDTDTSGSISSSITVTNASGTLYVHGTPSTGASSGYYTLNITPTDTLSSVSGSVNSATWFVF